MNVKLILNVNLQDLEQKSLLHHPQGPVSGQVTNIVFMFSQDALFGTTLTKYILPSKVQYARKIMFIYQFALFRQAKTEIIKASTNFEKSVVNSIMANHCTCKMTIYFPVGVWQAPVENSKNVAQKNLVSFGTIRLIPYKNLSLSTLS